MLYVDDVVFFGFLIKEFDFVCDVGGFTNNPCQIVPGGFHFGSDVVTDNDNIFWFVNRKCFFLVGLVDTGGLCLS